MKTNTWLILVAAILVLPSANSTPADEPLFLNVYRDASGHLTPASKVAEKSMRQIAKTQGYVTLWLTLNIDYDVYLYESGNYAAIAAQKQAVRDGFSEVLDPLVERGDVWYPADGPSIQGPGCLIRANAKGLKKLVHDDRILQIVGVE